MIKQYNADKCTRFLYLLLGAVYPFGCLLVVPQNKRVNFILYVNKRALINIEAKSFARGLVAGILTKHSR